MASAVPPRTLSQVFDATGGIPLLVLELGRILAARDSPTFGQDLPIADLAANPFKVRVAALAPRPVERFSRSL